MTFEEFWIKIENRSQYLTKFRNMPESHSGYIDYWKEEKRKVIEGMWGKESKGYRYCPGTLYFYANFFTILNTDKRQKTRVKTRPTIRTVEWVRAYNYLVCQGFSGFENDEEFSCDEAILDAYKLKRIKESTDSFDKERYKNLSNSKGLKTYVHPLVYCRKLFNKPMGKALYMNNALNMVELGSRGGGKSYWYSGLAAREILIDGTKYYNPEFKPQIYVAVGSEKSDKSQDLAVKIKEGIDALAEDTTLGVYGSFGDNNYTPNPLYKNMVGDITSNNKENYYRHVYKVMYKGELIPKGTKSGLYHFSYSIQKKNGAESAVGTRLNLSIIEEVGVTPNAIEIHNANIQCFKTDEDKFGVEIYTGTSGNMETVQAAKKLFESPKTYNCLEFDNFYEGKGSIGFFLPSYMIDGNFIDEDGNTDVPAAKAHYEKLHNDAPAEKIDSIRMDKPIVPADMWIQKSKSIFPKEQIKKRYNQLLLIKNQGNQEKFRRFVKLLWQENKVIHEYIDPKKATVIDSFFESQGKNSDKNKNTKSTDCDIIVYEEPSKNQNDKLYFFTLDTYVADEQDEGESLGCFQVWKSDFNVSKGETGNILVCEYTAKPDSRNTFYENIEKIIAWYGNPRRKLMFEANRGYDKVVEFFKKRGKEYLMSFSPNKYSNTWKSKITQTYGYLIGAKENKLETLNQFSEWLKESTILEDGEKLNLERLNSLGLLSELLNYDLEDDMGKKANYDRIMASLGFIIGQREAFNIFKEESVNPDENIYNAFVKRLTKTKK